MKYIAFAVCLIFAIILTVIHTEELGPTDECPCGVYYYIEYYDDDDVRVIDRTVCYCDVIVDKT